MSRSPVPAPGTNFRISAGASNALRQENPNDFGDYNGLSFVGGVLRAGWGDNSAELEGNPDAPELEIATAGVLVAPNGAVSVGPTVNTTRSPGYQSETSVAVNPTDPLNAVTGNNVAGADELGISVTTDGGTTWTYRTLGNEKDGLPAACCDPTMAYDAFGTLWYGYLTADIRVCILKSSDGGQTFEVAALLGKANETDQPTVVTGSGGAEAPQALWVTYRGRDGIVLAGAPVFGKGDLGVFRLQKAPGSGDGNFGDVAVGPDGEVAVVYQTPSSGEGPTNLFYHLDRDGLGSAIGLSLPIYLMRVSGHHRIREERERAGAKSLAASTNVGGFDYIPPQVRRSVDAESDLEFDTSAGPHRGRLYLAYTDENPDESNDTNIMLRFSDDQGSSWSAITQLNDDPSRSSQFFPKMSLDPSTGNVGAIWSDCRRDLGRGSSIDTDGRANTDVEIWGTVIAVPQTVPAAAPAAPTGASVGTVSGDSGLRVAWTDNSDNEETFEVERRESGAGYILIGVVGANATEFVDRDLDLGVEYAYRVRAVNLIGNSGYSNEATGTAASPPAAPSEVRQIAGGETSLTVGWKDNSNDESAFRVQIYTRRILPSGFVIRDLARTVVVGPNETSASFTDLEPSSNGVAEVQALRGTLVSETASGEFVTLIGLKSLEVLPRELSPGRIARLRVLLSAPAARGGVAVALSHDGPKQLRLPTRVRVRAGSMGAEVPVTLGAVKEESFTPITAELGESNQTAFLFIRPRGR